MAQPAMEESKKLQGETVTKLRILSHDLSNYIETIMQASYLLAQAKLDENNKKIGSLHDGFDVVAEVVGQNAEFGYCLAL